MSGTPEAHGSSAALFPACYATGAQAVHQAARVSPKAPVQRKCATTEAGSPSAAACRFRDCGIPRGPVRGCTHDGPPGSPRPRTYR